MSTDEARQNGYTNFYLTKDGVNYCAVHFTQSQQTELRVSSCSDTDLNRPIFEGTWSDFVSDHADLAFRADYFEFPFLLMNVRMRVQNSEASVGEKLVTEFGYTVK